MFICMFEHFLLWAGYVKAVLDKLEYTDSKYQSFAVLKRFSVQ